MIAKPTSIDHTLHARNMYIPTSYQDQRKKHDPNVAKGNEPLPFMREMHHAINHPQHDWDGVITPGHGGWEALAENNSRNKTQLPGKSPFTLMLFLDQFSYF